MIHGNQVTLRAPIAEDSDDYFSWINNKALVLKNADYKPVLKEEHDQWFNAIGLNPSIVLFSIVENHQHQLIGSCSLRNINLHHQNAELQIRIGNLNYHGRGFGSEATQLLVNYGFTQLHLKRIYLHVFCTNKRAIRAYEKCRFKTEGLLQKAAFINGEFVDVQIMAIINE